MYITNDVELIMPDVDTLTEYSLHGVRGNATFKVHVSVSLHGVRGNATFKVHVSVSLHGVRGNATFKVHVSVSLHDVRGNATFNFMYHSVFIVRFNL